MEIDAASKLYHEYTEVINTITDNDEWWKVHNSYMERIEAATSNIPQVKSKEKPDLIKKYMVEYKTTIKTVATLRNNKNRVIEILRCLLYMLYNTDYINFEDLRGIYTQTYFEFLDISSKYIDGIKSNRIYQVKQNEYLQKFINKKSRFCDKGKFGIEIMYRKFTDSRKSSVIVLSDKNETLKLLDNCKDVQENTDLKFFKVRIITYKDNEFHEKHANNFVISGNKVFRVEPNGDPSFPAGYFSGDKQFTDAFFKLQQADQYKLYDALEYQFKTDNFKLGDYTLNGINISDPVNKALYDFFEGTGYTFEGFLPDKINHCGGDHGGMCIAISALLSSLGRDITYSELKYFTIKQCESLFTEVSRLTFPPGTGKPVLDGPGEVIKKGDTTQELVYVCQFIKSFYNLSGDLPGMFLTINNQGATVVERRNIAHETFNFEKIISKNSEIIFKKDGKIDALKSLELRESGSINDLFSYALLKIIDGGGFIQLGNLPDENEMLIAPHVSFGKTNRLKQVQNEIKYLKHLF